MKLLYTLTAYPPSIGGAQLHQHMLAQQLKLRHKLQVVSQWDTNRSDWLLGTTISAPGQAHDYTIDGIPVHRIGLSARERLSLVPYAAFYYPVMNQVLPSLSRYYEKYLCPYAQDADLVHNVRIGREA